MKFSPEFVLTTPTLHFALGTSNLDWTHCSEPVKHRTMSHKSPATETVAPARRALTIPISRPPWKASLSDP